MLVRGVARTLRAALDERYDREMTLLAERRPWVKNYEILPPVRRYHAVHLASGDLIGPARNITQLDALILADDQGRPLRLGAGPGAGADAAIPCWCGAVAPRAARGSR